MKPTLTLLSLVFLSLQPAWALAEEGNEKKDEKNKSHVCDDRANYEGKEQLAEYCSAAELSNQASEANGLLWKLHAAAATVCGAGCYLNYSCNGQTAAAEAETAAALELTTTATFLTEQAAASTANATALTAEAAATSIAAASTCAAAAAASAFSGGVSMEACAAMQAKAQAATSLATLATTSATALTTDAVAQTTVATTATTAAETSTTTAVATCTTSAKTRVGCFASSIGVTLIEMSKSADQAAAASSAIGILTQAAGAESMFHQAGLFATEAEQATAIADKGSDTLSACLPFATETLNTFMKKDAEKRDEELAEENRRLAANLQDSTVTTITRGSADGKKKKGTGGGGTASSGGRGSAEVELVAGGACGSAANGGGLSAQVQCAITADPRVGAKVLDPQFQKNFEETSGIGLGNFLSNSSSPGQALGAGLENTIGSAAAVEIASVIDSAVGSGSTQLASAAPGSSYRGGGARKSRGGGDDGLGKAFGDIFKGIKGQLGGKGKDRGPASGNEIEFKMKRTRQQIEQDTSLSLFDRITYRYQRSKKKLAKNPWKTPYNRAIAGKRFKAKPLKTKKN